MDDWTSIETSGEEEEEEEESESNDITKHDQMDPNEIRRRSLLIVQDCASTILKKRFVKTAYARWSLQRSTRIILWDLYTDENEYCGAELTTYFNTPLNSVDINLDGLQVKDVNQSLLWNASALQYADNLDISYSASCVNNRRNTYYYEVTVVDKYDLSCIIL